VEVQLALQVGLPSVLQGLPLLKVWGALRGDDGRLFRIYYWGRSNRIYRSWEHNWYNWWHDRRLFWI